MINYFDFLGALKQGPFTQDETINKKIRQECIQSLYLNAPSSIPFHILIGLVVVVTFWPQADHVLLISWFVLLTLVSIIRICHVRCSIKHASVEKNPTQLKHWFLLSVMLSGSLWGGGYMTIGYDVDPSYRLLMLLTLAGMSAGAVPPMAGSRVVFMAYLFPILIPAMIMSFLQGDTVGNTCAAVALLFIIMMLITHSNAYRILGNSFKLQFENEQLISQLSSTNAELQSAHEDLKMASLTDSLTGLANRRHFDQMLQHDWASAKRQGDPLSCLMIDIDFFKGYNDQFGHQAGDGCLQQVAQIIKKSFQRSQDLVSRYGGEEFIVLLPHLSVDEAIPLASKLLENIRDANIPYAMTAEGKVTISIGIAGFENIGQESPEDLVKTADEALYKAKENGRNRIELAELHVEKV